MSSQAFLNEFDKHLFKTKTYGTTINKGNYKNYAQNITLKIDKTIKHLNQEHLYLTIIDNQNPKFDIRRMCVIEMAHSYNVVFVI